MGSGTRPLLPEVTYFWTKVRLFHKRYKWAPEKVHLYPGLGVDLLAESAFCHNLRFQWITAVILSSEKDLSARQKNILLTHDCTGLQGQLVPMVTANNERTAL